MAYPIPHTAFDEHRQSHQGLCLFISMPLYVVCHTLGGKLNEPAIDLLFGKSEIVVVAE